MLPKFANHLFGHFPRSSGSAFRNGFFNSSQGPSAGGAKYNAGSRFYSYNGYNGAGRAVTQASGLGPDEDRQPRLQRLSLLPRQNGTILAASTRSHLVRVRSNSTSAAQASHSDIESQALEALSSLESIASLDIPHEESSSLAPSADPAAPQTVLEPQLTPQPRQGLLGQEELNKAVANGNYDEVALVVANYRSALKEPTTLWFNVALGALVRTYPGRGSIAPIIATYHDMIEKNVLPNTRTYNLMIYALCLRDDEVQQRIAAVGARMKQRDIRNPSFSAERGSLVEEATSRSRESDARLLASLQSEPNFNSALVLFQAACKAVNKVPFEMRTYCVLLRSCSHHKAVDAAIRIFAHYERYANEPAYPWMYQELIAVHTTVRDIVGAQEVFEEFKNQSAAGKIYFSPLEKNPVSAFQPFPQGERSGMARIGQLRIWNEMIKAHFRAQPANPTAALALLEEMLDTPNGAKFGEAEAPLPSQETYDAIIEGFIAMNDLPTACKWFERLLTQTFAPKKEFIPCAHPPQPSATALELLFDKLAMTPGKQNVETLNKFLLHFDAQEGNRVRPRVFDRIAVVYANVEYIRAAEAKGLMDPVEKMDKVKTIRQAVQLSRMRQVGKNVSSIPSINIYISRLARLLVEIGQPNEALETVMEFARYARQDLISLGPNSRDHAEASIIHSQVRWSLYELPTIFGSPALNLDLKATLDTCTEFANLGWPIGRGVESACRRLWNAERVNGVPELSPRQWSEVLFQLTGRFLTRGGSIPRKDETENPLDIQALVTDFASTGIELGQLEEKVSRCLAFAIYNTMGEKEGKEFIKTLGPHLQELLAEHVESNFWEYKPIPTKFNEPSPQPMEYTTSAESETPASEPAPEHKQIVIDQELSRAVDEYYPIHRKLTVSDGLERLERGLAQGLYPRPEVVGRLINVLGRQKQLDICKRLYGLAQSILLSMEANKEEQSLAWFQVEDHMIIALAHGGDIEAAHNHRLRILNQRGSPSSDAYGALISGIKDTTDDVSYAVNLWQESQDRGVIPNLFLFNTVISRLAKGRKAEQALELFQQMKAQGLLPSTVTYGAVITACCRVGDAVSAEALFDEMINARRYTPRVPPFNTIMQLFVTTKPDREKVLEYYGKMRNAGVRPSDHTYKLLLDVHGSVQPMDAAGMERIFQELLHDRRVTVNGTHWASRINAYGCANRDLSKAIEVFNEIGTTSPGLPDAVCFEAILNALVTNHRTDLFPEYFDRMAQAGVHMTAYIANVVIRGYAAANEMDKAREIFENMSDPASGVAAPDNQEPSGTDQNPSNTPIYREPSTWEAMVRAELGSNNRDAALALIERMRTRGYPLAVLNRVNGILHDDSILTVDTSLTSPPSDAAFSYPPPSSGVSTPPSSIF